DILRGLLDRVPGLDAVTAHDVGLSKAPDPDLLAWVAGENRILVTHDRKTMPGHVIDRIAANGRVAGVFIVSKRLPIGRVIDDLEILVTCSSEGEWENTVRYLPL